MAKISFSPVEIAYKTKNDKPVIELYGKSGEKQVCVLVQDFEPYFWSIGEKNAADNKITRIEEHKKKFLGKEITARKIFVKQPSDVPLLREKFDSLEADIPFTRRFLIDRKITPLLSYEAEGNFAESSYKTDVFEAMKISYVSDELPKLRILAVDIETHTMMDKEILPENDPIIMIGLYGENFRKVLTWKHFGTTLDAVEVVDSEVALIERFRELVEEYKPDVITGYYSDGFDLPCLKARAEKYKANLNIGLDNTGIRVKQGKTPSAEITGIAHIDVFKFVKRIFRTSMTSFKLDDVAREILGEGKNKVNMAQLYHAWKDNTTELDAFAKYNLQDAKITYELCVKLMPNAIEFTKLIGLAPAELSRMSFSQLVEWYLVHEAPNFNELAPNKPEFSEERERRTASYEGGFVYEPTPGLYQNVLVFDFMSLYPTVISAHNISPDTIEYGEDSEDGVLKGFTFTQKKRGFISTVIEGVIERRLRIKELAKKTNDKMLEARQLALKTIANSIYGYYGFFGARWYDIDCAKAITAYGRYHVQEVIAKAKEAGLKVLYSDSLPYGRRVYVKFKNGDIQLIKIGELYDRHKNTAGISTLSYNKNGKVVFQPVSRVIRHNYKGKLLNFNTKYGSTIVTPRHSVYSFDYNKGVICLAEAQKLRKGDKLISLTNPEFRIRYAKGHVFDIANLDIGKYHKEAMLYSDNLLFPAKKGKCAYCNKELFLASHVFLKHPERRCNLDKKSLFSWVGGQNAKTRRIPRYWTLDDDLAWLLGFYCAEGSVTDVLTKSGRKCLLSFGGQNKELIETVKSILDIKTGIATAIIEDHDKRINKKMFYYRVQCMPIVALFQYGLGAGKSSELKKVPWFILNSEESLRRAFTKGYLDGDGQSAKDKRYATHFIKLSTKSKELAIGLDFLLKSSKHNVNAWKKEIKHVSWRYRTDKPKINDLRLQSAKESKGNFCLAEIRSIEELHNEKYVYDLEIKGTHNFVDAEGMILVHNTDSVFIALNGKRKADVLDFVEKINANLPGIMGLEYEGYYKSGIFVATKGNETGAKKKYALMREDGKMKIRGFETVRRNLSAIAKETQEHVLRMILEGKAKEEVAKYVRDVVKELRAKKIPVEKTIIRTQITREIKSYANMPPHVAIAIKMQEKGRKVTAGTAIPYIVTEGKGIIRERAKLPEEVKGNEYDPEYYIENQVLPAVNRAMEVIGYDSSELSQGHKQKKLGNFFG